MACPVAIAPGKTLSDDYKSKNKKCSTSNQSYYRAGVWNNCWY